MEQNYKLSDYRIYLMDTSQNTIQKLEDERFVRITTDYALSLSTSAPVESAYEIDGSDYGRLSKKDIEWITDCVSEILIGELKDNETEVVDGLAERIKRLEEALETERKKVVGE